MPILETEVCGMRTELATADKVVGAKQTKRALIADTAKEVFLAADADPRVTGPIAALCAEKGVTVHTDCSMKELGAACGIAVGCAVAAVL